MGLCVCLLLYQDLLNFLLFLFWKIRFCTGVYQERICVINAMSTDMKPEDIEPFGKPNVLLFELFGFPAKDIQTAFREK